MNAIAHAATAPAGGVPMAAEYATILRLMQTDVSTWDTYKQAPTTRNWIRGREATERLDNARDVLQNSFAAVRGWRHANKAFTLPQLRDGSNVPRVDDYDHIVSPMDHVEWFREANRPWRPAGIISHEYSPFEQSVLLAAQYGLVAQLLPISWYFPGSCNAVLYTAPRRGTL